MQINGSRGPGNIMTLAVRSRFIDNFLEYSYENSRMGYTDMILYYHHHHEGGMIFQVLTSAVENFYCSQSFPMDRRSNISKNKKQYTP